MAHKLIVAMVSYGKQALPFQAKFLFPKELLPDPQETRLEWIKKVISMLQSLFPHARIIIAADGAFASHAFLSWC